ncbi:MAG: hypothetical protein ACPG45_04970 [Flavobacteriaceae bacterium]
MKKVILSLIVCGALGVISCKSDDDGGTSVDCNPIEEVYFDAQAAYNLDATTENCNAYKTAIENYMSEGCVHPDDMDYVQNELDSLNNCAS